MYSLALEIRLLTDHSNGKGVSISVWETEANMMAGESSGHY